ncbi:MAG: glycogen debranching protein, partial [Phycisphaerae bacterium]|nr:glycogen debranching protein [Phycisphaerae bacterium]
QRYMQYSREVGREKQDAKFTRDVLIPACEEILRGYRNGTRFDIHADTDGLITGGSRETQLTWMDAKIGDDTFTARYGKAVEVNAMWYCAHAWLGDVFRGADDAKADRYARQADQIAASFANVFWNDGCGYLNDCVNPAGADSSLRANQIFAVSLPHSPLTPQQQRKVVDAVAQNLLTPFGLRTLAPHDSRYCGCYTGASESRERAYHQGTVWAWLIGGFVEAYLKVEGSDGTNSATAARRAKKWLAGFDTHLNETCLGSISEIFDGDAPHTPRGCCAQAWSVAEVLRAKLLVDAALQKAKK